VPRCDPEPERVVATVSVTVTCKPGPVTAVAAASACSRRSSASAAWPWALLASAVDRTPSAVTVSSARRAASSSVLRRAACTSATNPERTASVPGAPAWTTANPNTSPTASAPAAVHGARRRGDPGDRAAAA